MAILSLPWCFIYNPSAIFSSFTVLLDDVDPRVSEGEGKKKLCSFSPLPYLCIEVIRGRFVAHLAPSGQAGAPQVEIPGRPAR